MSIPLTISNVFLDAVVDEIVDFEIHLGRSPKYLLLGTDTYEKLLGCDSKSAYVYSVYGLKVVQCYIRADYIGVS